MRFMEIQRNIKGFCNASEYMRRKVEKRERESPHPTPLTKVVTRTNLPHSSGKKQIKQRSFLYFVNYLEKTDFNQITRTRQSTKETGK